MNNIKNVVKLDEKTIKQIEKKLFGFHKSLDAFREVAKNFEAEIQKSPESIRFLAENGWYLPFDLHIPTINHYAQLVKSGKIEAADNELIKYINSEIESIKIELIEKYPHRASIIKSAIEAHKRRDYYLSIPVFFSQIEGICKEVTGIRFFKLNKNKPATASWAETFQTDSIISILLEPLKINGITRKLQIANSPVGLNRHDILHGESCDYGESEVNSYKALSLLNYIGLTVDQIKKFGLK